MTGRRLVLLVACVVGFGGRPITSSAGIADETLAAYRSEIRALDREEFLADEPIWLCARDATAPAGGCVFPACVLVSRDGSARRLIPKHWNCEYPTDAQDHLIIPRGFEFSSGIGIEDPTGRHPLIGDWSGLPEGAWDIRPIVGDTTRVLARIEVREPTGAERSVRDGLARAARLAGSEKGAARAASLYEAIYRRYPRTTYLSVIYWGEWGVRAHTRFANDPGRWIEEIFAHFHDSCFGVIALDRWVRDMGAEAAKPALRHLVGIYPDTPLSRAALRYL